MKSRAEGAFRPEQMIVVQLDDVDNGGNDRYQQCSIHGSAYEDRCVYREIDWISAIRDAAEVAGHLPTSEAVPNEVVETQYDDLFPNSEADRRDAVLSLLTDPIEVNHSLIAANGRHRICALKAQGIKNVLAKDSSLA